MELANKYGEYKLKKVRKQQCKTITNSDKILRLNEKHFKKRLDNQNCKIL